MKTEKYPDNITQFMSFIFKSLLPMNPGKRNTAPGSALHNKPAFKLSEKLRHYV